MVAFLIRTEVDTADLLSGPDITPMGAVIWPLGLPKRPFTPGEFPFPLTGGPSESPFLTWLRNHSNYMAARGLLDYFRAIAVAVRGILINVALNLQGSKDINLRDRQSDFFIFSKKFIGSARTGYCRTATLEQAFPQIDLASAMAISAAAAAPNMGRGTSPALVAFMTLLNVRLGVWIPNPGLLEEGLSGRKAKRRRTADLNGRTPGFAFEEVFLDELASMARRWEQLAERGAGRRLAESRTPTPAHGLAGLGFSGGGIRSTTINLGIAQAAPRRHLRSLRLHVRRLRGRLSRLEHQHADALQDLAGQ